MARSKIPGLRLLEDMFPEHWVERAEGRLWFGKIQTKHDRGFFDRRLGPKSQHANDPIGWISIDEGIKTIRKLLGLK